MFQGYKKQVNSASQLSLKNTGEQRGIKRSIRLCPAPLHAKHQQLGILGDYLGLLGTWIGSFTFPAVWIEPFLLLSQSLGLHGVHPPFLTFHLLPLVTQDDTNGSVVLPRIHLCVLHSVLLGKEHEGIHWPLAFCRCGTTGCPWGVAPVWFAIRGLWGAGALKFITVWTDSTTAGQGGSALTSHAAENIHCWGI